jgi:hypothetical protein
MATKSINVKVSTKKVIDALQKALDQRKSELVSHKKADADYTKAKKDWEAKVIDHIKSGKSKVSSISANRNWRLETEEAVVSITLPASLAFPTNESTLRPEWQLKAEIDELENAIAVLKMTDEEFVSTSTYKGVAQYIK